jgi:hypothetical protein
VSGCERRASAIGRVGVVEANQGATRLYERAGFPPDYELLGEV